MGDGCKFVGKDGSNGTFSWDDVSGGGPVGATIQQLDLGGDGGDAKGNAWVLPPDSHSDDRDDGDTWGVPGVGIYLSGDVTGIRGTTHHIGVNSEAIGDHSGKGDMPTNL